jgi:hypothetical protein
MVQASPPPGEVAEDQVARRLVLVGPPGGAGADGGSAIAEAEAEAEAERL